MKNEERFTGKAIYQVSHITGKLYCVQVNKKLILKAAFTMAYIKAQI